ncbi:MAG: hypothetical protein Q3972_05445 [Corynebacterium sp.]|nr:hypothetical protein [Corynebacterium sp.]
MLKQSISLALAIVGLIVGAGFASGQEILQYFVAFGQIGIWGAVVTGIIMSVAVMAMVQLGSYFFANEHTAVFDRVVHPLLSRLFDIIIIFALFCIGFVMLSGAGANLNQQFGFPSWVGSLIMLVLVIACGFLNVEKVSSVMGAITPFIILAVIGAFIVSMSRIDMDFAHYNAQAMELAPAIDNVWISVLNYSGLALVLAVSMAIVIGGSHMDPKTAGIGGLVGGILFAVLLILATLALFFQVDVIGHTDMPMLALINSVNPVLGFIMAIVVYAMIFNTAIGLFYALGKRLTVNKPERFTPVFIIGCLVGFACSFMNFKTLVGSVYPILGYLGAFLVACLVFAWVRTRPRIAKETWRRGRIRELVEKKLHPEEDFGKKDAAELKMRINNSNLDNEELSETIHTEVVEELVADEEVDFSEADGEEVLEAFNTDDAPTKDAPTKDAPKQS